MAASGMSMTSSASPNTPRSNAVVGDANRRRPPEKSPAVAAFPASVLALPTGGNVTPQPFRDRYGGGATVDWSSVPDISPTFRGQPLPLPNRLPAQGVVVASLPVGGEQLKKASELRFCLPKTSPVLSWSSVRRVLGPSARSSDDRLAARSETMKRWQSSPSTS